MNHIFQGAYKEYWEGPLRWCHQCQSWIAPEDIFKPCGGPIVEACPCCPQTVINKDEYIRSSVGVTYGYTTCTSKEGVNLNEL